MLALRDVADPLRTLKIISSVEEIETLPPPRLGTALADHRRWRDLHDALLCAMQPPPGMLSGLDQAKIASEDYQLVPVIRAFERPLQRILIADDVGLGKTVEAILILLELRARSRGERILVVCPAGLQDQWADELREKAGLDFEIFDSARLLEIKQQLHLGRNPWAARRRIIASVDYVKRPDVKRMLRDITWDLVIVDEAHYLSETSVGDRIYRTERSRFGQFIANQTDSLVLLTATPHTGDPRSLWSLIDLVDPALVASAAELTSRRIAPVVVRRYKRDITDAEGRPRFKEIHVRTIPVRFGDQRERDLYDRVVRYCNRRWKRERDTAVGFAMAVIKKRLISSRHALIETLEERLQSLSPEPLDLDVKRGVLADLRAGAPLTEAQQAEAERQVLAAPPVDVAERAKERTEVERLLKAARAIPAEIDSKASRLLEELRRFHDGTATGRREKVIVFTEYRDTHTFLLRFLGERGYAHEIATLTGAMSRTERATQLEAFVKPETMLLLATDAASEGLNLQEHCRTIIHYELPWNPNRLEQRNGRVYRWGQRDDVIAANLSYEDTYDARILHVLLEKTERIRRDLGAASDVIGVMEELSWEELLMSAEGAREPDARAAEVAAAIDREVTAARNRLLAWRDRELGETERFTPDEQAQIATARDAEADRRLGPERRWRVVEWIVPALGGRVSVRGDGTVTIDVPQALRRESGARIDAAAFALTEVPAGRRGVEVLGMHHALLVACGGAARGALHDPDSPLGAARVAAKVARTSNPGILWTYAVRYARGDGAPYADEIVPVFAPLRLPVSDDPHADAALFHADPEPGAIPGAHPLLELLRRLVTGGDDDAPRAEVMRRAAIRAAEFERAEQARTDAVLDDLARWATAKRAWLESQLRLPVTQMVLEVDEAHARQQRMERELYERQRRRLEQELETLDAKAAQRRESLERRGRVRAPVEPELVGALIVIPAYEVL